MRAVAATTTFALRSSIDLMPMATMLPFARTLFSTIAFLNLLFATREGTPFSRNTFRSRVWRPAVAASGVDFHVRVHDLRHAHASWLLAGGSDLKSVMDRMGHAQITTTQKYLHTLPDADAKNLTALDRIRRPDPGSPPEPA
jgi:site-specific recombinase XerD